MIRLLTCIQSLHLFSATWALDPFYLFLCYFQRERAIPLPLLEAVSMQCFAGIVTVSVGHCHDRVMEAVNKQNSVLQHTTTIYLNNEVAQFAKELTDRLPADLKVNQFHHSETSSVSTRPPPLFTVKSSILPFQSSATRLLHSLSADSVGCQMLLGQIAIPEYAGGIFC